MGSRGGKNAVMLAGGAPPPRDKSATRVTCTMQNGPHCAPTFMAMEDLRKPDDAASEGTKQDGVAFIENAQLSIKTKTTETVLSATETSGRRQVFSEIRRQLAEEDLASKGVQKLLLSELETSEGECEALRAYIERFHDADKRAAVLEERSKTSTATEIMFAVGLVVGGGLIGWAPALWDQSSKGPIALALGIVLIAGSAIAKALKK
jgi:hypothetical protein